ncbi:ATP-binding cassette domain-containing protein [Microbacterium sp. MEC084]|uniref:sugar ABC transporter ATP-binding protein n=1 Tax=unclassified Microbacterium TaxID=2609290 RepID=UPI0006F48474|nr:MULTISPECIES: sugar ABC transporter ATP-binding protein [unclassified Microbacterium]KQZ03692.1 sugar ABC transporter ATP-binding protein [Microbacterium sp. Root53]MCD1269910.1 ATP-binding cassette domain-containing protein [Microbacterium sp. MEC084]
MSALLELRGLSKAFGPFIALSDVSLKVLAGQVHAVMGENGAGKSTLIKALSGLHAPSSGEILFDGRPVRFDSPTQATDLGIRTVFQELHIAPHMSVAENITLGSTPTVAGLIDRRRMRDEARAVLSRLGVDLDVDARAGRLSRSEQQLIEIARSLIGEARLLILDEPTASLGESESRRLLDIVRRLAGEGVGVIYVSHRMHEVLDIADVVTVLRDGVHVATHTAPVGADALVEAMIGRPAGQLYAHTPGATGPAVLEVANLSAVGVHDASLVVHAGEVVGIAGLIGSGKSELARTLAGLQPARSGTVLIGGKPCGARTISGMLKAGLMYYPSDRRREGLVLRRPLYESVTLGALGSAGLTRFGLIDRRAERRRAEELTERLALRPADVTRHALLYSGGNQQKALIARGLLRQAVVHVFDEPTVGIDVGAKADVYAQIDSTARGGAGVVVVSSDLTELIGISDRVYVVAEGRIRGELRGDEITEQAIAERFF